MSALPRRSKVGLGVLSLAGWRVWWTAPRDRRRTARALRGTWGRLIAAPRMPGYYSLSYRPSRLAWLDLARLGWIAGDLETCTRRLATEAVEADDAFLLDVGLGNPYRVAELIVESAGVPAEVVRAWLGLLGFCTSKDAAGILVGLRHGTGPFVDWVRSPAAERLGALAPLAWAAGMQVGEAANRLAAGTLEVEGLMTLAALRGYPAALL